MTAGQPATEAEIRAILEANPQLSIAEARAQAEGRTYNPTRDYSTYAKSVHQIRKALLREHKHNVDIGELLVQAVTEAQLELDGRDEGEYLTQNRPGSWEAALVEPLIQRELHQ